MPLDVSRCVEGGEPGGPGPARVAHQLQYRGTGPQERDPAHHHRDVEELYTSTFEVEFQLDGQVADGYQMGLPAVEPETVTVSGSVEEVSQVARVVAVLTNEDLSEQYAGDPCP